MTERDGSELEEVAAFTMTASGYEIALLQAEGPARRRARVVPRYIDVVRPGHGIAIAIADQAAVQAAADELADLARQLLTAPRAAGRWGVC